MYFDSNFGVHQASRPRNVFFPQILPLLASLQSFIEHENQVQFETPRFSLLFLKFFQKNREGKGVGETGVRRGGGYGATFINHIKN